MKAIVICVSLLLALSAHGRTIGGNFDNTVKAVDLKDTALCTPPQWEGFSTSWYPELKTLAMANTSYDFDNKKLAIDVKKWVWSDDDSECSSKSYSMIFRFDKKKAYFFHDREDGKNCTVKDLDLDFEEWCVPKDARSMGPFTVGGKLEINGYHFNFSSHDGSTTWMYFESTKDGIPVTAEYGNAHAAGVSEFYDITGGIDDPEVFNPPDFCDNVQPSPWHHGHRPEKSRANKYFSFWQFPHRV
jgi:hypothetical protein